MKTNNPLFRNDAHTSTFDSLIRTMRDSDRHNARARLAGIVLIHSILLLGIATIGAWLMGKGVI